MDRHAAVDCAGPRSRASSRRTPANLYDFSFLAPCPSSGLIVHGEKDAVVRPRTSTRWSKNSRPKGHRDRQQIIPGANHFFDGKLQPLMET